MKKVNFPINKKKWNPSLIPGIIALISTYDLNGNPNVAPKSWIQMVSFEPSILMFSGSKDGTTEKNIEQTNSFAVNFIDSSLASLIYNCIQWYGNDRITKSGLSLTKAKKINAPLIKECKANLECKLVDTKEIGSGYVIFGEITAASIWEEILKVSPADRYELLDQIVFLENNLFSRINKVQTII